MFADELCSLGFSAHAAKFTESYDLAAGVMLSEGYISERKRTMQASRADNLYGKRCSPRARRCFKLIRRFKGPLEQGDRRLYRTDHRAHRPLPIK